MATSTLIRSLNWRFYSVLIILTVTIFIFIYNTFIINEINKGTKQNAPLLSMKTLKNIQLQQMDKANPNQLHPNYNAPSSGKYTDKEEENETIIYHPDGYIIGNPLIQNECKNAIISQIPDRLLTYFPNFLDDLYSQHWFVSRESYSPLIY